MTAPLTAAQLAALKAFRDIQGPGWRRFLATCWELAKAPHHDGDTAATLHGLRNSHGPRWLATFRFPVDIAPLDLGTGEGQVDPALAERHAQWVQLASNAPLRVTRDQASTFGLALFDSVDQPPLDLFGS